jgi:GT2 family glycosyltransferase
MDLSILIVNWNAAHYMKLCLASVYREVKGIEFEVIVIDNASYDGSAELLRAEFPQATFIQSDQNLGFIRGNNLLFKHARGRNILLLNPDTEIIGNALQRMLGYLESLPQAGVIGCRLVNADGSVQTNSIQTFPTILNQVLDADFLRRRFPNSSLWNLKPLYDDSGVPVEVDSVSGACFMIKRSIFERVGLMSEDYLMYGDDIDLCFKVKKAGYKVYYTNSSRVVHYGGKSTASWKQALADVWIRDSIHKFLVKFRGRCYGGFYKATMAAAAVVRLVLISLMRLLARSASRRESLSYSFTKWKRLLLWALGFKQWAKKAGEQIGFVVDKW